jgi:hypothetical protein
MPAKEQKTRQELTQMIMEQIRRHSDLADVADVAIRRPIQTAPHQPNWRAEFVLSGRLVTPEGAFRIARDLHKRYDLAR